MQVEDSPMNPVKLVFEKCDKPTFENFKLDRHIGDVPKTDPPPLNPTLYIQRYTTTMTGLGLTHSVILAEHFIS